MPLLDSFSNAVAVFIFLDRDPLHIDSRRRGVAMSERVLRVGDRAALLSDDPRVAVPHLMQMHFANASLSGVLLQVLDERVRTEHRTRLPCPIMARPQRPISRQHRHPIAGGQIRQQPWVTHFPADVIAAFDFASDHDCIFFEPRGCLKSSCRTG
jgi:hypothetical protein